MISPEEDKARIEKARAMAQEQASRNQERTRRDKELWDNGINPLTGKALDPELKSMVEKDWEISRKWGERPYAEGRGVIRVHSRTRGRNRKVRRG